MVYVFRVPAVSGIRQSSPKLPLRAFSFLQNTIFGDEIKVRNCRPRRYGNGIERNEKNDMDHFMDFRMKWELKGINENQ